MSAAGGKTFAEWAEVHLVQDVLADGRSGDVQLEKRLLRAMVECYRLFQERHAKYGRANIARSGERGVVVRVGDKLSRLENLVLNGAGGEASDESVEDTWMDVANYGLIGLLVRRDEWTRDA